MNRKRTGTGTGTETAARDLGHLSLSARTVHADDYLNSHPAVAPPMHVATTFRYNDDPDKLQPWKNINVRSANRFIQLEPLLAGENYENE